MPILVNAPILPDVGTIGVGEVPELVLSRGTEVWPLNLPNSIAVLPGVEGLDEPPRDLIESAPATWDGSIHRAAYYRPREVFLPLALIAESGDDMRAGLRRMAALLDPKRGATTLTVAHTDGTTRDVDGYGSQSMGKAMESAEGSYWRRLGVTLKCPAPYWQGPTETVTFNGPSDTTHFLGDFLPIELGQSQVIGAITIENSGDAEAYPTWTITGPGNSVTVTLGSYSWTIPAGLSAGETLVVDTTRGSQSITKNGASVWSRLGTGSTLWALQPGTNYVTISMASATEASQIVCDWRTSWLTAW